MLFKITHGKNRFVNTREIYRWNGRERESFIVTFYLQECHRNLLFCRETGLLLHAIKAMLTTERKNWEGERKATRHFNYVEQIVFQIFVLQLFCLLLFVVVYFFVFHRLIVAFFPVFRHLFCMTTIAIENDDDDDEFSICIVFPRNCAILRYDINNSYNDLCMSKLFLPRKLTIRKIQMKIVIIWKFFCLFNNFGIGFRTF